MAKPLPSRPNLDHLRTQAKRLLAALRSGDEEAVRVFQEHLPAAKGKSATAVRAANYRLADAQSALARKTGFAAWPQLARHVEQLRSLEGTWAFVSLEVDGSPIPAGAMASSRISIDGDRFRTDSPEAVYEGEFNINVDVDPHQIDIEFVEGPERGNWNYGIFRLSGDRLEICLNMSGGKRPSEFETRPETGHAYEVLQRESPGRPHGVTGGSRQRAGAERPAPRPETSESRDAAPSGFEPVDSALSQQVSGEWAATRLVLDGKEMPGFMVKTGKRTSRANQLTVEFGGGVVISALVRYDETSVPISVDYFGLAGSAKGKLQQGIMEFRDQELRVCMSAPGQPRPTDFSSDPGSGRTLSHWKQKK